MRAIKRRFSLPLLNAWRLLATALFATLDSRSFCKYSRTYLEHARIVGQLGMEEKRNIYFNYSYPQRSPRANKARSSCTTGCIDCTVGTRSADLLPIPHARAARCEGTWRYIIHIRYPPPNPHHPPSCAAWYGWLCASQYRQHFNHCGRARTCVYVVQSGIYYKSSLFNKFT